MAKPEKQRPIVIDSRAWTGDLEADARMDAEAQKARARWLQAHPFLGGLVFLAFGAAGIWACAQAPDSAFGPWWLGWVIRRLAILGSALFCLMGLISIWWPGPRPFSRQEGWRAIKKAYAPPHSAPTDKGREAD